jgi:hypothetical protein
MSKYFLFAVVLTLLTGCQGSTINITKLVQETFAMLIMAGIAYSGGVLILGHLTDIKWMKHQAEERGKQLVFMLAVTLIFFYFDKEVSQVIAKATNLFGVK